MLQSRITASLFIFLPYMQVLMNFNAYFLCNINAFHVFFYKDFISKTLRISTSEDWFRFSSNPLRTSPNLFHSENYCINCALSEMRKLSTIPGVIYIHSSFQLMRKKRNSRNASKIKEDWREHWHPWKWRKIEIPKSFSHDGIKDGREKNADYILFSLPLLRCFILRFQPECLC